MVLFTEIRFDDSEFICIQFTTSVSVEDPQKNRGIIRWLKWQCH